MPKTIGYVLDTFPVFTETFVGNEMRAMAEAGHRIVPIVLRRNDGPSQEIDRGLAERAIYLDQIGISAGILGLSQPRGRPDRALDFVFAQRGLPRKSLLWNAAKIARVARLNGCEHLHAHFSWGAAGHAITAARWTGMTVSFICHGYDVYAAPADLPCKLQSADFVVAVCEDLQNDLHGLAPGAKTHLIHCGIDPSRFKPAEPARQGDPGSGPGPRRVLFIGRLVESKGVEDLVAAVAALPPARRPVVDMVGDGPLADTLRRQIAAAGIEDRVRLLGRRSSDWIAAEGPAYDAFVAPFCVAANGDRDTGPVAVKEAMAMGLPIIASRWMGLREMITPSCGWLFPPKDRTSLAETLMQVTGLPQQQLRAMGEAARARVSSLYSIQAQAAAFSLAVEAV